MDLAPSVYEHAAAVIGETPWRVSRDPELLFQAHAEAFRLYRHAPVVVGIDIYNLEAEAYGATIPAPTGNALPSISASLCQTCAGIMTLDMFDPRRDGRIPMVIETGKRLAAALPDADIRIPVSGPFSLASNLVGFDCLLCDIIDNPQTVRQTLDHLARGQIAFAREIVSQGMQIALFESGATPPLVSPESFAQVALPVLKHIITEVSSMAGHPVPCIIGGNTLPILGSILETGTGYVICPSETDQSAFMQQMAAHPEVMVRINTNPAVFAAGSPMAVRQEIERVLRIAGSRQKVCIGTGALPFDTKPDLVLLAKKIMRDTGGVCQPADAGDA
ncbi:MAG: uroporphyrinogen decarboxylase family protein [Kiritimatiellae bacterium]|nr:uroporphyrinogen decarboxylase family protein [Kiritimatiellia bacterium]